MGVLGNYVSSPKILRNCSGGHGVSTSIKVNQERSFRLMRHSPGV